MKARTSCSIAAAVSLAGGRSEPHPPLTCRVHFHDYVIALLIRATADGGVGQHDLVQPENVPLTDIEVVVVFVYQVERCAVLADDLIDTLFAGDDPLDGVRSLNGYNADNAVLILQNRAFPNNKITFVIPLANIRRFFNPGFHTD